MNEQSSQIHNPRVDSDFDDLLRSAKVEVPLPGTFQAEVWRRIAVIQGASQSARLSRWMERAFGVLVRPVGATAAVLGMISAGAWFGSLGWDEGHDGKIAYVQAVSPFAQER